MAEAGTAPGSEGPRDSALAAAAEGPRDPAVAAGPDGRRIAPAALAAIAVEAANLAPAADRERRLSPELVRQMTEAGVFRMLVPSALGGFEAHPGAFVASVETIASGDGAAGWCAAINATSGLLAAYLPEPAAREIYADPRTISGGVFAPLGRVAPATANDGYRVTGRWPFASGCTHCDWLMGGCIVDGDARMVLAPAAEFTIHDTWHSMGLRGSGSHDIELRDVHVPQERTAALITGTPTAGGPLYAFPLFGLLAIAIGAVGLGIAGGALNDVVAMAGARKPTGSSRTMGERTTVQAEIARATATLDSARAYLHETIDKAWQPANATGEVPTAQRAALRLAATHAACTGADVTATAFRLAGGAAVYETRSALPRRFRDAHTATQHMLVAPATEELAGRVLLGLPTDTSQL